MVETADGVDRNGFSRWTYRYEANNPMTQVDSLSKSWNSDINDKVDLAPNDTITYVIAGEVDAVGEDCRDWKVGDPLDPATHIGALIDADHCMKVRSFLDTKEDSPFVAPVVVEVSADDVRARDEIFGPVLSVIEVASNDEAVQVANDTAYGLAASVFSASGRSAIRAARDIKAGTVTINCYGEGNIATPFGGYKQSGFGGRDNGIHAHDQYTEVKTIWIDLNDPSDGDNVG